jgi:hypothetical protein
LFEIAAGGDHLPTLARASAGSLYALAHFPRIDGLPILIMPPLPRAASARLAVHVDKIKETSHPFRGVCWEQLAIARADGGARCKCAVYKRLFVKKTAA